MSLCRLYFIRNTCQIFFWGASRPVERSARMAGTCVCAPSQVRKHNTNICSEWMWWRTEYFFSVSIYCKRVIVHCFFPFRIVVPEFILVLAISTQWLFSFLWSCVIVNVCYDNTTRIASLCYFFVPIFSFHAMLIKSVYNYPTYIYRPAAVLLSKEYNWTGSFFCKIRFQFSVG